MSYVARRMAAGETVVIRGRFHWSQYLGAWLALLLLGVFIIGIAIWVRELVRLSTTEFVVTSRRVVLKKGWLNTSLDEITLNSVEGAHIERNLLGRMFGYGKLTLRGKGDTHIEFPTMARPDRFRSAIEAARISEDRRPIETIVTDIQPPTRKLSRREMKRIEREHRHAH